MELNRDFVERFKDEYEKKKSAYLIWNSIESRFERKLLITQEFQTLSRSFVPPSLESARKLLQRLSWESLAHGGPTSGLSPLRGN